MDYKKEFKEASDLFNKGAFLQATEKFAFLAYWAIQNIIKEINPMDLMQLTVKSYRNWCKEQKIDFLLDEGEKENVIEQYYSVVRHYLDHKQESDLKKIQNEITREIPLGAMQIYDSIFSDKTNNLETGSIGPYSMAVVSAQGPRETMEDVYLAKEQKVKLRRKIKSNKIQVFAVFDGHGGSSCACFAKEYLLKAISLTFRQINSFNDLQIYNAISKAFIHLDESWRNLSFQKTHLRDYSGTTATAAIIIEEKELWIANVGDSRAVISVGNDVFQLSVDAKPTDEKYREEIHFRGGYVMWGRVDGNLDMARSIGDIAHPSISARPTIKKFDLTKIPNIEKSTLILACDGLWNVVDPKRAALTCLNKPLMSAANDLKSLAYKNGSTDNVTILLVRFT